MDFSPPSVIFHNALNNNKCSLKCSLKRIYSSLTNKKIIAEKNRSNKIFALSIDTTDNNDNYNIMFNNKKYRLVSIKICASRHVHMTDESRQIKEYEVILCHTTVDDTEEKELYLCIPVANLFNNKKRNWVDVAVLSVSGGAAKKILNKKKRSVSINLNNNVKLFNPFFFYVGSPFSNNSNAHTVILKIEGNVNIINIHSDTKAKLKDLIRGSGSIATSEDSNPTISLNTDGMTAIGSNCVCSPVEAFTNLLGQDFNSNAVYNGYDENKDRFEIWPYNYKARVVILALLAMAIVIFYIRKEYNCCKKR